MKLVKTQKLLSADICTQCHQFICISGGFEFGSELGNLCAGFCILNAILEAFLAEIFSRVDEIHCPRIRKKTGENKNPRTQTECRTATVVS
jgi:hypothetical protein